MITSWPLTEPFYPLLDAQGQQVAFNRTFEPDVGPPIERRATTAGLEVWQGSVILQSDDALDTLVAWWRDDLAGGSLPFIWRHPHTTAIQKFKITGGLSQQKLAAEVYRVSFSFMRLPGAVWFAEYVPGANARLPVWVADYTGGVYGVNGARGVVGDLAAVSGTYLVWTKRTNGTHSFGSATYSGDIPATAPAGVDWLVGFDL